MDRFKGTEIDRKFFDSKTGLAKFCNVNNIDFYRYKDSMQWGGRPAPAVPADAHMAIPKGFAYIELKATTGYGVLSLRLLRKSQLAKVLECIKTGVDYLLVVYYEDINKFAIFNLLDYSDYIIRKKMTIHYIRDSKKVIVCNSMEDTFKAIYNEIKVR